MYKDTVAWVGGIYQAPDKDVRWSFVQAFLYIYPFFTSQVLISVE
jgi:hypothetical protein